LHKEKLQTPGIVRIPRWAGHVARMGRWENHAKYWWKKLFGERILGWPRRGSDMALRLI